MKVIEMKDGRRETIGNMQNAIDLVREYCGDNMADCISNYIAENERNAREIEEYLEQKEAEYKRDDEKYTLFEDLWAEHIQQIEKYENQKIYEEFTEESAIEILAKYKELVEKIHEILYKTVDRLINI